MSNLFDTVRQAVAEAKEQLRAADTVADAMARLLVGRLRNVDSGYALATLKAELRDFNACTKRWKDK